MNHRTFRPRLAIAASSNEELSSFDPPPFSLRNQPQRPGELAEPIEVPLDAAVAARVRSAAAAAGLPLELAIYIAIEAQRAVDEAAEVIGVDWADLAAHLDAAAAVAPERFDSALARIAPDARCGRPRRAARSRMPPAAPDFHIKPPGGRYQAALDGVLGRLPSR